tara:strand:+ start:822 stop:1118 length:297 start_codon:yes stop_codon:yes gene_type:complete
MQTLFSYVELAFPSNAAVFIEGDGACPALIVAVAVLHLAIASGHCVGCAEGALDIGAGHAGMNLLFDQRISPCAPGYAVSASIILCAYNGKASRRLFL